MIYILWFLIILVGVEIILGIIIDKISKFDIDKWLEKRNKDKEDKQ